jgi:hypothetical protein
MLTGTLPPELATLSQLASLCARPPARLPRDGMWPPLRARPPRAMRWLRSGLGPNGLSGSLASWIGSLVKLTRLYALVAAGAGSTGALCKDAPALRQRVHRVATQHCCAALSCRRVHARADTHARTRTHTVRACVRACVRVCVRAQHRRAFTRTHNMNIRCTMSARALSQRAVVCAPLRRRFDAISALSVRAQVCGDGAGS